MSAMNIFYITGAVVVGLVGLFLAIRIIYGGIWGLFTKTIASLGFVFLALLGILQGNMSNFSLFIMLGLLAGLIGDIVLDLKLIYKEDEKIYLNAGMLSFGIGHIFYLIAGLLFVKGQGIWIELVVAIAIATVLTGGIMLLAKPLLKLDFGKFKIQTMLYTWILSFMSAFSIALAISNPVLWWFASGITLIFASDLVLSMMYFGGKPKDKILCIINHSLYYLGQIAIAGTLFAII